MDDCYLSPKGVQSFCRDNKLWLNKMVIYQDKEVYTLKLWLYKSYKTKEPRKILIRRFQDKEVMKSYVLELWSLYPSLEIQNKHLLF
jgi:hypothetical protein